MFRINVFTGWAGDVKHLSDGSVLIRNARMVSTGVPQGFSDLIAIMPGGQIAFIECKTARGRPTDEQRNFLEQMHSLGCRAGIARCEEDAIRIITE